MKTIREPFERVIAANRRKTLDPAQTYRLSLYLHFCVHAGVRLVLNTFTGEIVRLSPQEYDALMYIQQHGAELGFLEQSGLSELAKRRFIVESDYDEPGEYLKTLELIRLMSRRKPGLKTYTILPTTGCNARCVYCYEQNYAVRTMTGETARQLVDFICETRHDDQITLSWFGGEPLIGHKTISYICRRLTERGVPFRSGMVTNASLFTKELVHEAKKCWNLEKVQVSLDGDRHDYMERKQYMDPVRHNYDVVMGAIRDLSDEGIRATLRVNYDKENISRLRPFLDEIKAEFGRDHHVTLYLSALYQENNKPYYVELEREMFALKRYMDESGINQYAGSEIWNASFRVNYCMADGLDKSIVIDPDGRFFDCEHMPEGRSWGNIFDGITDRKLFDKLSAPAVPAEKCRECPYLPQCTPFYRKGCPGWYTYCREYRMLYNHYELECLAKRE